MLDTPHLRCTPECFDAASDRSVRSARVILPVLFDLVSPASVLHIGCGAGEWLKVASELGVDQIAGVDRALADTSGLFIPVTAFSAADLERPVELGRRFDLVLALEVAHQFPPDAAPTFVESLVRHGDVVLFSAAIPGQEAHPPANPQWPSYWAERFARHGYAVTDGLRTRCWLNRDVDARYSQNMLLFVSEERLAEMSGLRVDTVRDTTPLPLVHPEVSCQVIGRPAHVAAADGYRRADVPASQKPDPASADPCGAVIVTYADEIAGDDGLLSAVADAVGRGADASLVVYAPDAEPSCVLGVLAPALADAGYGGGGRDATLLCVPASEGDAFLAARASIVVTRRTPRVALASIPHVAPGAVGLALAQVAGTLSAPSRPSGLAAALLEATLTAAGAPDLADNVDLFRFAGGMPAPAPDTWPERLAASLRLADALESLWERIDQQSRDVIVSRLAYRTLGYPKIRMGVGSFTRLEALAREIQDHMLVRAHTVDPQFLSWMLDEYDLAHLGLPLRLHTHPLAIVAEFMLRQYQPANLPAVEIRPGDVVIDGGGCWGETALHFAFHAGSAGRVHTFEFERKNLKVLHENLEANPALATRVILHRNALWRAGGERLRIDANGPGTRVAQGSGLIGDYAQTESIDAMITSGALD